MKRALAGLMALTVWVGTPQSMPATAKEIANINEANSKTANSNSASSQLEKIQTDTINGISEYKLKSNGLQVLLAERHHTPIVTVMVVYHVGSRNEAVGYTGSTHFLEHMMFRGTKEHDPRKGTGFDDVLKPLGGINNATTFYDRTNYYEVVPAQYLSTALDLEADRMRNALLRKDDHDSEMTVVRNELERNEDDPSKLIDINLFAHAFEAHPYHHPVIGWRSDVENVPIDRLRRFYNDFYYPNNATLVVIGDFKSATALSLISSYFDKIPASPKPFPPVYTSEPPQEGERRFIVQRGEDLPKVALAFHIPRATDKDTYALEVMASLLGDDRKQSSRLYKALVDTGLASDCYAYNYSLKDPSLFTMLATATPGTQSEKLENILLQQAQDLAHAPISEAELEKAKKSVWKRMRLDAADPMGLNSQLAEAIAVADWRWWVNLENNIKAVTSQDVQRVAAKYFNKRNETVGYYYPTKQPDQKPTNNDTPEKGASLLDVPGTYLLAQENSGSEKAPVNAAPTIAINSTPVIAKQNNAATKSIAAQVSKKVLANGLTVLVLPVKGSKVVAVAGKILAGDYFRPRDVYSIPDFVTDMLDKGSQRYSKEELAQQLEAMGTSLDFSAGHFSMNFESDVVSEDLPQYLQLLSDTLQNPNFAQAELDKEKKQHEADITAAMSDTGQVAANAFYRNLYKPDCVYYQPPFKEQISELPKVTVERLREFHKAQITPGNSYIAIVGDIDPDNAFKLMESNFSSWTGPAAAKISLADCAAANLSNKRIDNPLPDKTNVDVLMGVPAALSIKSGDFYAASVANAALGHDTISSRLADIRNKHGLTYGISSYFSENQYEDGPWIINFSVNPNNLSKSIPLVKSIVSGYVKNGITAQELSEERKRLAGEYIVERMRTPHNLADALTKYEMLGLGAKFMDEYPRRLQAVTQSQANEAIKKYFQPDHLMMSVAGTIPATENAPAAKR